MAELLPLLLEPLDDSAILGREGFLPLDPLHVNLVTSNNPAWEAKELLSCLEERAETSLDYDLHEFTGRGRSPKRRDQTRFNQIVINSFETKEQCRVDVFEPDYETSGGHNKDTVIVDVLRTASLARCERGPRDTSPFTLWIGRRVPYSQVDLSSLLAEAIETITREKRLHHEMDAEQIHLDMMRSLDTGLAIHLHGKKTTQISFLHFPCRLELLHFVYDLTQEGCKRRGHLPFDCLAMLVASPRYRAPQRIAGTHSTTAYTREDLRILQLLAKADLRDQSIVLHDIPPTLVHRRVCRLVRVGVLRWKAKPRGKTRGDFAVQAKRKPANVAGEDEAFLRYRDHNKYRAAEAIGVWEEEGYERPAYPMPSSASVYGLEEILHKVELVDAVD